jgi:FKBP-type peptidyl-prolyl cis-trans isomerase 2
MIRFSLIFILILLVACNSNTIKTGDEIYIVFTLKNEKGERIDDNFLPSGDTLPLRLIVGKNYLIPEIDKQIIGKKRGDKLKLTIPFEEAYGNSGVYYLDNYDTVYIIKPTEDIEAHLKIL